jgi:3-dehydroquinate dehydratase type I
MTQALFLLENRLPLLVGSMGGMQDLRDADPSEVRLACDLAEIRLDLLVDPSPTQSPAPWHHLHGIPLLFTARRKDEGGGRSLDAATRMRLLSAALDHAACLDIEVASIDEMDELLQHLKTRKLPWIASFHDFFRLPDTSVLIEAAQRAHAAGARIFKVAAHLAHPADLARLAEFQLADHPLPVATMGMGPLAAVSRLLCAQCGSALNYGHLGKIPTAPGQWPAALLQKTLSRLDPFRN